MRLFGTFASDMQKEREKLAVALGLCSAELSYKREENWFCTYPTWI